MSLCNVASLEQFVLNVNRTFDRNYTEYNSSAIPLYCRIYCLVNSAGRTQKLEDILPDIAEIKVDTLKESLTESGRYICKNKQFVFNFQSEADYIFIDSELVIEVYENILANAQRYAYSKIKANISITENLLKIVIHDDGKGFTDKALQLASEPFYRDEKEQNSIHFGLGLYICKIICGKCGGSINISNTEMGGKVTAIFFCESR